MDPTITHERLSHTFSKSQLHAFIFVESPIAKIGLNNIVLQNRFPLFPNTFFFLPQKLGEKKNKTNSPRHQKQEEVGCIGCSPEQHNGFLLPFRSSLPLSLQSTHKALHDFLVSGSSFTIFPLCVGKKLKCKHIL